MIRLAITLCIIASPVFAADLTFTRADVEAAYAMGRADAILESAHGNPAARQLVEKLKPTPPSPLPKGGK